MRLQYADFIVYGEGVTESPAVENALDANTMYLTVISEDTPAVTVQVMTGSESGAWIDVPVTLPDGTSADKVTENGLYVVSLPGATRIRVLSDSADATLQVYGSLYDSEPDGTLTEGDLVVAHSIAKEYDETKTYAVGSLCMHDNSLQRCETAIETAEKWNSGHWHPTTVDEEIGNYRGEIDALGENAAVTRGEITDAENVDLDVTDTNGNVILRIEDGFILTKNVDTRHPYVLPTYYTDGYLDRKIYRIKYLMQLSGGDAFIFCTDQHMWGNARQSYKLIHHLSQACRIRRLFMGGDLENGVAAVYGDEFRKAIGGRAYFMGGNHDYMEASEGLEEKFACEYSPDSDDAYYGDPLRAYYYVDNPKHKLRYIVTNSFAPNGSDTWTWGFEATQMTWLTDVAMDVPDGWKMVIFSHMFWRTVSETSTELTLPGDGTGNPWDGDMKAVLDTIDAHSDGRVLAIIQGHTHTDAEKATDGGIPILITTCDKWEIGTPGHEPQLANRIPGTVTEQAFDVCVVDQSHGKLYAVRIGGFATGDFDEDDRLFEIGERVIDLGGGT